MLRVRFTVPGTPVPLERARGTSRFAGKRRIRFFTPDASVKYQEKVRKAACYAGCPLFRPGCLVELRIYLPDKRRRDRDNIEKGIMDALQAAPRLNRRAIAWVDDHQVGPVLKVWGIDREQPRVEVIIEGEVAGV